jgi:hypothetical protein
MMQRHRLERKRAGRWPREWAGRVQTVAWAAALRAPSGARFHAEALLGRALLRAETYECEVDGQPVHATEEAHHRRWCSESRWWAFGAIYIGDGAAPAGTINVATNSLENS